MASEPQELVLMNQHAEQGAPDNIWRVQFADKTQLKSGLGNHRVTWTVVTPDQWAGDLFKLIDYLTEKGLNPGSPKVYVYATTAEAMSGTADRWMLDSLDTLHAKPFASAS